jgi:LacI family transcriptional regulator
MARRPTLTDIANEAGVGVATVDRVLNGRAAVREATVMRVAEAAERLGYHATALLRAKAPALPLMRFGFVLSKEKQPFYQNLAREIERAVADCRDIHGKAQITFVASGAPDDFSAAILQSAEKADAVAAVAVNHHSVTKAVSDISTRGIPFFAMLNDFAEPARQAYYGMDNLKVGRLAAWMLATKIRSAGKVAIFVGGSRWHGHMLRETGFASYLRENAPDISVLDTFVNLDTRQVTYEATLDLLDRHADLRGIYVAGGGIEGAIAALRDRRPPGKIALVGNELTQDRRAALADGYMTMVISTPIEALCRNLVDHMVKAVRGDAGQPSGRQILDPLLYLPESI